MKIKALLTVAIVISLSASVLGVEKYAASKIVGSVEQSMPRAKGVSASFPITNLPGALTANTIKSVNIKIEEYFIKGINENVSLEIAATDVSKSAPTTIGSLDVVATIPASTIIKSSGFSDAKIVDNALQVSVGSGGLGQALLIPKYSNNTLFFELKGVYLFGNEIPASSLPSDIQDQIKKKSMRNLNIPKELKVMSVSIDAKGLSVKLHGDDIELDKLGASL